VLIVLDAAMAYSERYAGLAREMAAKETNLKTQEGTGTNCSGMSPGGRPTRTGLVEAVQSVWMIHCIIHCELYNINNNIGRIDQYLFPFLQTVCN